MTGFGLNPVRSHFYKFDNKAHTRADINKMNELNVKNVIQKTLFYAKKAKKKIKQEKENVFFFSLLLIVAVLSFLFFNYLWTLI